MEFGNKTLDTVENLSANSTTTIKLPRDRFVKDIMLYVTLSIKNSGGSSVSVTEADIIGLIERLRVTVNGRDTLVDVNAYRKFLFDFFMWNTKPYTNIASSIGAGATVDFEFEIPIVFAINPAMEWDVSAVVPAHLTSSFNVYVEVGDPTDIDANLSIESGSEVEVTVKELYCTAAEEKEILSKLKKVYELEISKLIDAAYSNYTFAMDLDVGNIIQKLGIFAYNSAGALSDSIITAFKIKQESPVDRTLEKITWMQSKAEDKRIYDLETLPTGITIWDAEFRAGGLDTRGLKSGDVKFKANTASGGSGEQVVLLHREIA